jgi:ribosomal protein L37AE/L43A|tara:strand:+ start:1983 stop:2150 length:168 start_codon:yes stop_codon:yes gene_type:complete
MEKFKRCRKCGGLDEYIMTQDTTDFWYCDDCKTERAVKAVDLETPETRAIDRMGE